jgi:predicted dinucleotide-binding enzyme
MKKVGVIGSGTVGEVLANGFLKHGYAVVRASRDPSKLQAWKDGAGPNATAGSVADAAAADLVVLAVKGTAAEEVVALAGALLDGKTVIDATNPIAEAPPVNGVLSFFTGPNDSLMERLQQKAKAAHFVKAFSCVGNAQMVNPDYGGTRPSMFICGDDDGAKTEVRGILDTFGWDTEDMGKAVAARAIEPLCILWCISGFLQNRWTHAFKVLTK